MDLDGPKGFGSYWMDDSLKPDVSQTENERIPREIPGVASTFAAGGHDVPEPSCLSVYAPNRFQHLSLTQHVPFST